MNISIIGAGNGGQAMAGHFSLLGHNIKLYNRTISKIKEIVKSKEINLNDKITGTATISCVTDDLKTAISGAAVIMVTTTADAHKTIAIDIAPYIEDNQIIVLNPGRTLGALEFSLELKKRTTKRFLIAEAQSLIYACRADKPGNVRVIGVKSKVFLSAFPSIDTDYVLDTINKIYPCFVKAENILFTSLENIGAILHPSVILFNAAAIERGNMFYFYNDMTHSVAHFIEELDKERLEIGKAFNIELLSVSEWVSYAYKNIEGRTFLEKIRNNPAYYKILAPTNLKNRMLLEDIPTGILPMIELGRIVGINTPLMQSVFQIAQSLIATNLLNNGRTFANLGLDNLNKESLIKML